MAINFTISFRGVIKRSFDSHDNGESGVVFSTFPTSSIVNDFIPYHALMSGKLLSKGNSKALLYNLDLNALMEGALKGYEDFFHYLITGVNWVKLEKKNTISEYRCRAGQLVTISKDNVVTPLMTLVVNKEHLFNINKETPDFSKFFVVISKEFSESNEHSNLYKNFCKYYLDVANQYVDIIHTKNIISFCYKQVSITPIKPKTISESKTLYKELTYNVLRAISLHQYT